MNTFRFGLQERDHTIGDGNCRGCRWDIPQPCKCGGLVHIEDTPRQPYVFKFRCDRCVGYRTDWKRAKKGK